MKLEIGKQYNGFTYEGLVEGDYSCDSCGKHHYIHTLPKLHWFRKGDDLIKIGTTCINRSNLFTELLGVSHDNK